MFPPCYKKSCETSRVAANRGLTQYLAMPVCGPAGGGEGDIIQTLNKPD